MNDLNKLHDRFEQSVEQFKRETYWAEQEDCSFETISDVADLIRTVRHANIYARERSLSTMYQVSRDTVETMHNNMTRPWAAQMAHDTEDFAPLTKVKKAGRRVLFALNAIHNAPANNK